MASLKIYFSFFFIFISTKQLTAQDFSVDYWWPHLDRLQIVTCRDDGFACLNSSVQQYQEHSIIKFNAEGKLVFRYVAVPEKMFKKFIKKGETWNRKMFELSNGNLIVWFSAKKEGRCPVDLYYYIISADGKLLTANNVPFENYKAKEIENPELDNVVMVNDNEFVLSVMHGGSCKEIFNNSATNKSFLFNISNSSIKALHDLDGHRVVNCITGNSSIYLLTLPIRFYKNDQGVKTVVDDRLYNLWKFSSSFEKQQQVSLWQYPENNTYMEQMKLKGDDLQVFFCQRALENGEYGYQLFDANTLLTGRKKSFSTELYPHDVYAAHDKYFLPGTTIITDAAGEDMILFHVEAAKKSGYGDDKTVHAQVVQDGMIRNEKMITVLEEKRLFAVSQPNSKGTYIMASNGSSKNFMGNFFTDPLLVYSYEGFKFDEAKRTAERRKAIEAMKTRFVKTAAITEGTMLEIAEIDKNDLYAKPSKQAISKMQQVFAGKWLIRRGDGYYTGYVTDAGGRQHFVYGARFLPGNAAVSGDGKINVVSNSPESFDRSRPYTVTSFSKQYNNSMFKSDFPYWYEKDLTAKKYNPADLARLENIVQELPLPEKEIDDSKAKQWIGYIVLETPNNYLIWIPQNENMHMEEKYRPKKLDGFAIFVFKRY